MSDRRFIDTNLIIRHLVQDSEKHAKAAERIFDACDKGQLTLVILPVVLAECVFVLESFYKHPRAAIAEALQRLVTSAGVEIDQHPVHLDALSRYGNTKVHFVDCMIAATACAQGLAVATFDQDFRKFSDVRVKID